MTDYFGDAGYWIALIDSDDELHEPATRYERILAAENARTIPASTRHSRPLPVIPA